MQADQSTSQPFLQWFKNVGGTLNDAVGITDFPGMSRGAIAVQDIEKDTLLFTIPRKALLSTKTSSLRQVLGEKDWAALGSGWQPLILSMMWEESKEKESYWYGYLEDLPEHFDTLMFWSDEELDALQASTIGGKIGKADVEKDYYQRILPIIQRRSDVFDPSHMESYFGIKRYHINGNRILSRSFQVEEWSGKPEEEEDNSAEGEEDTPMQGHVGSADLALSQDGRQDGNDESDVHAGDQVESEGDDQDDSEESEDIAMVPMADILNARYGCNNARLFYEKDHLQMVSTQTIKAGEQIWNTYGDLPNTELLRRYGHVDIIPIQQAQLEDGLIDQNLFPYENPADEVEVRADLVVEVCLPEVTETDKLEKIEAWLQLGGEDIFAIDKEELLCKPMLSMIRYLSMSKEEVQKVLEEERLPKGKANTDTLQKLIGILGRRLEQYKTLIIDDELFLSHFTAPPNRLYNATFVRLCEKRLLEMALNTANSALQQESTTSKKGLKRGRHDEEPQNRKKAKR